MQELAAEPVDAAAATWRARFKPAETGVHVVSVEATRGAERIGVPRVAAWSAQSERDHRELRLVHHLETSVLAQPLVKARERVVTLERLPLGEHVPLFRVQEKDEPQDHGQERAVDLVGMVGDGLVEIANAARRFLEREADMDANVHEVFAGHLRQIVGAITVEDMIRAREKLASETRASSAVEMEKLGLIIDSLQIQQIEDPTGYIENLAKPHKAAVEAEAEFPYSPTFSTANRRRALFRWWRSILSTGR